MMSCSQQAGTRTISLSAHTVSWDSILLHEKKYKKESSTPHNHTDTEQQHRDNCELVDQGVVLSKSTQKWGTSPSGSALSLSSACPVLQCGLYYDNMDTDHQIVVYNTENYN